MSEKQIREALDRAGKQWGVSYVDSNAIIGVARRVLDPIPDKVMSRALGAHVNDRSGDFIYPMGPALAVLRSYYLGEEDDVVWLGRMCLTHLAEAHRGDSECDYADAFAEGDQLCRVLPVIVVLDRLTLGEEDT